MRFQWNYQKCQNNMSEATPPIDVAAYLVAYPAVSVRAEDYGFLVP